MKSINKKNFILTFAGLTLIFVLWFLISEIIGEKVLIFPGPIETFKYLFTLLGKKRTYISVFYSFWKMILGYGISIILALLFGIFGGLYDNVNKVLKPLMTTLKAIPTACLLFFFIALSGFANAPIFVVILVAFPILYESVVGGIRNIPKNISEAIALDGGNSPMSIFKVKVPMAANYIMVGIASSFALAFKVEIMSEVLSSSRSYGIGSSIKIIQSDAATVEITGIFAWAVIAIVLLLLIEFLTKLIKKTLIKYQ